MLEADLVLAQELPQPFPPGLRRLQRVKGCLSSLSRVVAVASRRASSSGLIRRGRPPAHRGSKLASSASLNRWITPRIVSSPPWTSRVIVGTVFPLAKASTTIARRSRTAEPVLFRDLLQPLTLVIGRPAHPDWICHPPCLTASRSPAPNADRRVTKPAPEL